MHDRMHLRAIKLKFILLVVLSALQRSPKVANRGRSSALPQLARTFLLSAEHRKMFGRTKTADSLSAEAIAAAISRSQTVIEFRLDGTIVAANENFLHAMGYTLAEIKGKHHSMFVAPGERDSAAYREFWARLNRGEFQAGEFKRIGRGGKDVWILATYNPIV